MFKYKKMKGEPRKRAIKHIYLAIYYVITLPIFLMICMSALHIAGLFVFLAISSFAIIIGGIILISWIIDKLFEKKEREERRRM